MITLVGFGEYSGGGRRIVLRSSSSIRRTAALSFIKAEGNPFEARWSRMTSSALCFSTLCVIRATIIASTFPIYFPQQRTNLAK